MELSSFFSEIILLLAASVLTISLFRRINLTPILAYLFAGLIVGPSVFGWVTSAKQIDVIAELGVVFLLFSLGLEFSIPKLVAMRRMVFGTGTLQVIITMSIIMLIVISLGVPWQGAFAIGGALALSSTAIVIKQLSEQGKLKLKKGQLAISVLLFQDIAVVPMLITIPILSAGSDTALGTALGLALLKGVAVFIVLLSAGKWLLPRVFDEIAQARTDELFVLTTLLVALIAGGVTHLFGLSMALGAFLAGMMLGESQYKHQLEADIRPFRDILMGLFFTTVGMKLDLVAIWHSFHWLVLSVASLLVLKTFLIYIIAKLMGQRKEDALASGIMLCQMGEFGFVLVSLASENLLISSEATSLLIGIGVLSMGLTPFLVNNADRISVFIIHHHLQINTQDKLPGFKSELKDHVIICGFGRVGQTVARFLKIEAVPYVALDFDPVRVQEAQQAGEKVHFGDVRNSAILNAANISKAALVIITLDDSIKSKAVVHQIKALFPDLKVVVRTTDDEHLQSLKQAGATEVVPEKLEGSLMLVLHVLYQSGVPVKRIFSRIRRERRNQYNFMHGFFPGENLDISSDKRDQVEFLHAIALPQKAYAIGKTLSQLNLAAMKVEVIGLRRDNEEMEKPSPETYIEVDDVLVVMAKAWRMEKAERYLLKG